MSDKITHEELQQMFGATMPMEVAKILFDAPDGWTIGQVRAEVRRIAGERKQAVVWNGVPLNPERDGWHWLFDRNAGGMFCEEWTAERGRWLRWKPYVVTEFADYLGPCLTPAEVEARERAAWQRACEVMREAAANWAAVARQTCNTQARVWAAKCETLDQEGEPCGECKTCAHAREASVQAICYDNISIAIRALPIPEFKP